MRNSKGLTVLEMLVVVVVIAILAAVLSPGPGKARCAARKSICQRNLKEVAIALHIYMNDYDGCLPSSMLVNHSKKWNSRDFNIFATRIGTLPPRPKEKLRTWPQILYDHMRSKDVMFCPNDEVDREDPKAKTSYWWKTAIDKAWYGDGCKPCRKEQDFAFSSDQIILYEHSGWHSGDSSGKLKNGMYVNAAYLDSHVKTITLKSSTTAGCDDPIAPGEPRYFNKYVAGEGPGKAVEGPAKYVDPRLCGDWL